VLFLGLTAHLPWFRIRLQECFYNLACIWLSTCQFLFGKILPYLPLESDSDGPWKSCPGCFLLQIQGKGAWDLRKLDCRIYGKQIDLLGFLHKKGSKLFDAPFSSFLPIESFRIQIWIMIESISNILFLFGHLTRNRQTGDMFFPYNHDTLNDIFGLENHRRKVAY
jgi:hypothetical protein